MFFTKKKEIKKVWKKDLTDEVLGFFPFLPLLLLLTLSLFSSPEVKGDAITDDVENVQYGTPYGTQTIIAFVNSTGDVTNLDYNDQFQVNITRNQLRINFPDGSVRYWMSSDGMTYRGKGSAGDYISLRYNQEKGFGILIMYTNYSKRGGFGFQF